MLSYPQCRFCRGEGCFSGSLSRWRVFDRFSASSYLMCRTDADAVRYAPLCIYSFRLMKPRKQRDTAIKHILRYIHMRKLIFLKNM